jgi:hypothetical protein
VIRAVALTAICVVVAYFVGVELMTRWLARQP